ncbi:MAG: DUF167 domain-containing protein [Pirellulales bacterium]
MLRLAHDSRGVILPVRVHAQARRSGIVGVREGMLRVAVTAAPEKGKANRAVVAVLSRALGVPKSALELLSGETSPQKRFLIVGMMLEDVRQSLGQ